MQHFLQTIPNMTTKRKLHPSKKKCSIYIPPKFDQLEAENICGGLFFFLMITRNLGEMIQFDKHFSDGLVQPPPSETMMVAKSGLRFEELWASNVIVQTSEFLPAKTTIAWGCIRYAFIQVS